MNKSYEDEKDSSGQKSNLLPSLAPVRGGDNIMDPAQSHGVDLVHGKKIKITNQLIEIAYQKLRSAIEDKDVTPANMVLIVTCALQISNNLINMSTTYKVELALAILRKLIDNTNMSNPNDKMLLHLLVETTVPGLIQKTFAASSGDSHHVNSHHVCCVII